MDIPHGRHVDDHASVARAETRDAVATTTDGEVMSGTAKGVADGGQLLVETASGVREVGFGEIAHLG